MNYLLDTCTFLWWIDDNEKLSKKARDIIANSRNIIFVSSVSIWEISIKKSLGKLEVPQDIVSFIEKNNFEPLAIQPIHAELVGSLPDYHNDPFDRMLIAQAQVEGLIIITSDKNIAKYQVKVEF